MFTVRESSSGHEVQYDVEPALLAKACQRVLAEMGSVKSVSRETGVISGRLTSPILFVSNPVSVVMTITRVGDQSKLSIKATTTQGMFVGGANPQVKIAEFLDRLSRSPELAGRSLAGW